jgi:cardiolipin synthase
MKALQLAALRGVDVRIITSAKGDSWPTHLAAFHYIDELRDLGIRFYAYAPGFMHQKVMLIDDDIASVGTHNLDNRSFRLNFEVSAVVIDEAFNSEMTRMLEADFQQAQVLDPREFDRKTLWWRAGVKLSRLAAPLL